MERPKRTIEDLQVTIFLFVKSTLKASCFHATLFF